MIPFEVGTLIAGKYRLERALARGGMGSVWVARQLQLDTTLAIKLMAPECASSSGARVRFEREAKASAQIKSPHVVRAYDYGIEGDTPFIVMDLLEGEDLEARLRRQGCLSVTATARVVSAVCKALRLAHEMGLVHRDLKPGNIFFAREEEDEVVKVLDFGIAKALGSWNVDNATETGALLGSPRYMSPEQVRNVKQVDHRSDLWSLGVIVFRCLTGQLPFPDEEIGAVLVAICTDPIPVPSQIAPGLGPEVDRFVERALTRDPAQRFQSAREFADELLRVAAASDATPRLAFASMAPSEADPSRSAAPPSAPIAFAPPAAPAPTSVVAAATNVSAPHVPQGTLSPSGRTLVSPLRRHGRAPAIFVAASLLTAVLGLLGVAFSRFAAPAPKAAAPPTSSASPILAPPTEAAPSSSATSATAAPQGVTAATRLGEGAPPPRDPASPGHGNVEPLRPRAAASKSVLDGGASGPVPRTPAEPLPEKPYDPLKEM